MFDAIGARSMMISSYDLPKFFYGYHNRIEGIPSAAPWMSHLGVTVWYSDKCNYTAHKKRTPMDIDAMLGKWKDVIVGLCLAHDKDAADRYEASVETCLQPILAAPIKQVREFATKLMEALKADPRVPYLVWRPYEIWVAQMKKAPDEDVKELKADLARQIVDLVEEDVQHQLPEAMIRALQWRSSETLEQMRGAVEKEKGSGRKPKLVGKESCLFLAVIGAGTEEEPEFLVQI